MQLRYECFESFKKVLLSLNETFYYISGLKYLNIVRYKKEENLIKPSQREEQEKISWEQYQISGKWQYSNR